jgi:transcriptional regulator with PAS, ATPase and Fis domain
VLGFTRAVEGVCFKSIQMKHQNEARHLPVVGPCTEPVEQLRLCGICRRSSEIDGLRRCSQVIAESPAMRQLLARTGVVATTTSSVVIHGETGAGKEVIARLIHANSARHAKPFVAVNVAALPPDLLESELFGHVKGSFTGALTTTAGLFGEADGGTLLLDEIGEMPPPLQAKLLRVLQEGEIRRVGEPRARPIDVRVLSATHRDLEALVAEGRFREDLYYRLKVFTLSVPPLRERREDILPLAELLAGRRDAPKLRLSTNARKALERYGWPGNVRELGNVIEHAVAFARGGPIQTEHFPEALGVAPRDRPRKEERLRSLRDVEREHIARVMRACGENQGEAARVLGIGRSTLWRKLSAPNLR